MALPEVHELRLDPTDPASGERLKSVLSAELEQERATARRRRWMGLVALASVPIGLGTVFPRLLDRSVQHASLALWAGALLVTCAWTIEEWRGHRRLRALLGEPTQGP